MLDPCQFFHKISENDFFSSGASDLQYVFNLSLDLYVDNSSYLLFEYMVLPWPDLDSATKMIAPKKILCHKRASAS